jgi:hypothetical protein
MAQHNDDGTNVEDMIYTWAKWIQDSFISPTVIEGDDKESPQQHSQEEQFDVRDADVACKTEPWNEIYIVENKDHIPTPNENVFCEEMDRLVLLLRHCAADEGSDLIIDANEQIVSLLKMDIELSDVKNVLLPRGAEVLKKLQKINKYLDNVVASKDEQKWRNEVGNEISQVRIDLVIAMVKNMSGNAKWKPERLIWERCWVSQNRNGISAAMCANVTSYELSVLMREYSQFGLAYKCISPPSWLTSFFDDSSSVNLNSNIVKEVYVGVTISGKQVPLPCFSVIKSSNDVSEICARWKDIPYYLWSDVHVFYQLGHRVD